MRILFVYCNTPLENMLPLGISQLIAVLRQAGHEVGLFDTTFYKGDSPSSVEKRIEALQIRPCPIIYKDGDMIGEFRKQVETFQPDILAFTVVEPTFRQGLKLLDAVSGLVDSNGIRVLFGGVHAILSPQSVASMAPRADFICIGEGENAMPELCSRLETGNSPEKTPGFWARTQSGWVKNAPGPLVDLNQVPVLDFTLFPEEFLEKPMMGQMYTTISLELTRGCPYRCSYCGDHALTTMFKEQGRWFRQKSMNKIHEDLAQQVARHRPRFLTMMSESFLAGSLRRVTEFAEMYQDYRIPFWFNTRPEDITPAKAALMKSIGATRVSMGIESGNEAYRKQVLNRNVSNKRILEAASILRDHDISFSVNLILGFPDETRDMVFESIELCRQAEADAVSTHIFNPYHGTHLREVSERKGYIAPGVLADDLFMSYSLKGNTLDREQVLGLFRTIPLYVSLPKQDYARIRQAESFTPEGEKAFALLKESFYSLKGWNITQA